MIPKQVNSTYPAPPQNLPPEQMTTRVAVIETGLRELNVRLADLRGRLFGEYDEPQPSKEDKGPCCVESSVAFSLSHLDVAQGQLNSILARV
jgi:hypothetical protein